MAFTNRLFIYMGLLRIYHSNKKKQFKVFFVRNDYTFNLKGLEVSSGSKSKRNELFNERPLFNFLYIYWPVLESKFDVSLFKIFIILKINLTKLIIIVLQITHIICDE